VDRPGVEPVACEGYRVFPFGNEKQHWLELLAPAFLAGGEPIPYDGPRF
jgi:hypothetical protein